MNRKIILLTLVLILFAYPVHGFLGSLFKPAKESDMISYYAPCWGENNTIYFIKCVTFGVAIHEKDEIGRALLLGGDYFVKDVKYFLCSMNYNGTEKREITELLTKKAMKAYKKKFGKKLENYGVKGTYMGYCPITKKLTYDIGGIWIINTDGTDEECIADEGSHPSWSPDGKKIVYRVRIKKGERTKEGFLVGKIEDYDSLWVMDADGANKQKIFSGEVDIWVESPIWSPKGDLIAFVHNFWIWVMKPDGSERRKVCKGMYLFDWTPDGERIIAMGVYNLNGQPIGLKGGGYWSPDGRMLISEDFILQDIDGKVMGEPLSVGVPPTKKGEHFVYKRPNNIW